MLDARGLEAPLHVLDRGGLAGEHDLRRLVVVGDAHRRPPLRQQRPDTREVGPHRRHRPSAGGGARHLQPAALRDEHRLFGRDRAGGVQRHHLAERMTGHGLGPHPDLVEQAEQRQAHEADRRLRALGRRESAFLLRPRRIREHGRREDGGVERLLTWRHEHPGRIPDADSLVERHGDRRAHLHVLAALTGEQEGHLTRLIAVGVGRSIRQDERLARRLADPLRRAPQRGSEGGSVLRQHTQARRARAGLPLRARSEEAEGQRVGVRLRRQRVGAGAERRRIGVGEHEQLWARAA